MPVNYMNMSLRELERIINVQPDNLAALQAFFKLAREKMVPTS